MASKKMRIVKELLCELVNVIVKIRDSGVKLDELKVAKLIERCARKIIKEDKKKDVEEKPSAGVLTREEMKAKLREAFKNV